MSLRNLETPGGSDLPCPCGYKCRTCGEAVCAPHEVNTPDCPHGGDLCAGCRLDGCTACWDEEKGGAA